MKRRMIWGSILWFFSVAACGASPWKNLHEKADRIEARDAFAAAQQQADSTENLYILALVYLNQHKDKEAKEIFEKMMEQKPQASEARWGLAEVLRRQHKTQESEEILSDMIKTAPDFSPSYITLAYIRYTQKKFDEAVRLAKKVLARGESNVDQSNHVRAHLILAGAKGMIAHYGGPVSKMINGTSVLPNLRRAEALQPDSAGVKFGLGAFFLLAPALVGGDLSKAEDYLKEAIAADPLLADAYVRLGQLYQIKGDDEKYRFYLDKALAIDPGNELAQDIKSGTCFFICPKTANEN